MKTGKAHAHTKKVQTSVTFRMDNHFDQTPEYFIKGELNEYWGI